MTDDASDRRKRSKWDEPRSDRSDGGRSSYREERERSSGRSRWDDRREERRSRSPGHRRSKSPPSTRLSATPSAETKKVDPAAAAG
jgi:hypothetical protein